MNIPMDVGFTEQLATAARSAGLPVALAGFAGNNPNQSVIPLRLGHDGAALVHGTWTPSARDGRCPGRAAGG
ncbi:MAG: hypothetical protein R2839_11050 [Thermomicrobiales bacterium]